MAQSVVQLTCIQEVTGLNPGEQIFFLNINTFASTFFRIQFWQDCYFAFQAHGTWAKLNACNLGTRICWLLIDSCFGSFITVCWKHWCEGKLGNTCHFLWCIPVKTRVQFPFFKVSKHLFEARFLWHIFWAFALTLKPLFSTAGIVCITPVLACKVDLAVCYSLS